MFVNDDEVSNRVQALPDSDVLIAQATNDGFALNQFYKTETNSREIHYENYGSWSIKSGIIDERESKIISRRRGNLRGKLITSSYVLLDRNSENHLTDFADKNVDSLTKASYAVINTVLDSLNVSKREFYRPTWGYFNEKTQKWSGMVGDIIDNDTDIGGRGKLQPEKLQNANFIQITGSPMFISPERMKYVDYIPVNTPTSAVFIFRSPQMSAGNFSYHD